VTRRHFDHQVTLIVLVTLAFIGIRMDAKRRVGEGKTAGISGMAARAASVAL